MSTGSVAIITRVVDETTFINLRISHPMEPGTRKDKQGVAIPAWYLTQMEVFHDGVQIAKLELGPLVSRNPAIALSIDGAKAGEVIKVNWADNRGISGEQSREI